MPFLTIVSLNMSNYIFHFFYRTLKNTTVNRSHDGLLGTQRIVTLLTRARHAGRDTHHCSIVVVVLYVVSCLLPLKVQARCLGHTPQIFWMSVEDSELVVLLVVLCLRGYHLC